MYGVMLVSAGEYGIGMVRNYLDLPVVNLPTLNQAGKGIILYDRYDHYICTLHADRDTQPVPLSKISPNMRKAVLAAEDRKFFQHHGIDFAAVVRALLANRKSGHIKEGASTITQQLVRNLYLDRSDRSYRRKLRETCLAWNIESRYSKAKILETYLNEIYFGRGVHGVERAARAYFDKPASRLSVSESAFLAGLIKAPTTLSLVENRPAALHRQKEVLNNMAKYGFISQAEARSSQSEKLAFSQGPAPVKYPYYVSYAMQMVKNELGEGMWKNGFRVYTNLDPAAQQNAEQTLARRMHRAPAGLNQAALVSMSLNNGAVLAMVGGVGDYESAQWNRAIHPHTAGSAIKPFVYLSGIMQGVLQPDSVISDAPLAVQMPGQAAYCPKNFDGRNLGWLTTRDALCRSRNVCAVRVAQQATVENVIETAHLAGIRSQLNPNLSLALGSCAVSPLDMATSYGTLARGGVYMAPQMLRSIKTEDGKVVRTFCATASANLPAAATAQLVDVMQDVVRRGTGTQARLSGIAVAGKTGTADKGRDIWFTGFTPDTVTSVWAGNDANRPVKGHNVTGGAIMASMWQEYMSGFYRNHPCTRTSFPKPEVALIQTIPDGVAVRSALTAMETDQTSTVSNGIASVNDVERCLVAQRLAAAQPVTPPTAAVAYAQPVTPPTAPVAYAQPQQLSETHGAAAAM